MTLAVVDATYRPPQDAVDGISASRYTMPFGNVPLVSHVIGSLADSGVERVRVLAAAGDGPLLQAALDRATPRARRLGLEVIEAPEVAPRQAVLAELDAALHSDPVLLTPGDSLASDLLAEMSARYAVGDVDLVLAAGDAAAVPGDLRPERLTGSPVLLGPATRRLVAELIGPDGAGTALTGTLLASDLRLAVCDGSGGWTYDGTTAALLSGNRHVLDSLPHRPLRGELADSNQLHGRISLGRGVFLSGCTVHGPVAIADHVVLEDSYIGPFTSIGTSAVITGTELEDSIVLAGAELHHPGQRVTASVIGQRARVDRTFGLPRGLRVRLSADSQVTFS